MTTINRAPWNALIDDSGNNLDGTPWTKDKIKTVLLDPIDVALASLDTNVAVAAGVTVITSTDTGTKNDFVLPGRTKDTVWLWSGSADLILNGLAGGALGDRLTIKNQSNNSSKVLLPYNAAGSAGANRWYNVVSSAPTPLAYGGWITYVWNQGWTPINYEQGVWITAPFSAANFVGLSGMTWTVTAGAVARLAYRLSGRTLTVSLIIGPTTLGGTPSGYLQILPAAIGGFTAVGSDANAPAYITDGNATTAAGMLQAGTSSGIVVQKFGSNYGLGASQYLYGQLSYEVN